jgi:hypothetical protein
MERKASDGDGPAQPPPKARYAKPVLVVYGDLRKLTAAAMTGGKNDHIGGPFKTG